ncbi:MAG: DUF4340 domain-containing protein [Elusimicrobiota bacterium]
MKKNLVVLFSILTGCILLLIAIRGVLWLKAPKYPDVKFSPDKVIEFLIKSPVADVLFYQDKDGWKIRDNKINRVFKGEKDIIMRTLEGVAKIRPGEIISNNKLKQPEFEVNESSGIFVELKLSDKEKISFVLGKQSYDFQHYYFRFTGSDEIRLCEGLKRFSVERDRDFWRPSRILQVKREGIKRLEVNFPLKKKDDLILSLKPGTTNIWIAENLTEKGKSKEINFVEIVKPLLYTISDFMHDGIMPLDKKWERTLFTVKMTAEEGNFTVLIGDKLLHDGSTYYLVKRDDEDTIYKIHDFKMLNIRQKKSDIK